MNRLALAAALCGASLLAACGDKVPIRDITGTVPASRIKFFNFSVGAPNVNFFANDQKLTAIVSATGAESTIGTAYGAASSGGLYNGVAPGQYTFTGRISATTDNNKPISTIATTIADGKFYSYYQSGFYDATNKVTDAFIVEDDFPAAIDYTTAYVRFVNAISNSTPLTLVARDTNATTITDRVINTGVAYKSGGAFTAVPGGVYTLNARNASGTTQIIRTSVSFVNGFVYTISARGDITVTSSTATNRPFLDNTTNR